MSETVAVVGPFTRGVSFEIHAPGCADLSKTRVKRVDGDPWLISVESFQEIVEATFADHIAENREGAEFDPELASWASWKGYVGEFRTMPCCPELPEQTPVTPVKPRRSYTLDELINAIAALPTHPEPGTPEWREHKTLTRMFDAAEI